MNRIAELSTVLQLSAATDDTQIKPCDCCGHSTHLASMACSILNEEGEWLVAWSCPDCTPTTKATNGSNIKRGTPMSNEQIDATLIAAADWLDAEILSRNKGQPFIRRPTFIETQRAAKEGRTIPNGAAIVVTQHDETHLRRRALPMPFPWHGDEEWMAGASAAREALAMADAIERGDAEITVFPGGNSIITCSSDDFADMLLEGSNHG